MAPRRLARSSRRSDHDAPDAVAVAQVFELCAALAPARAPPYWQSRVLRRQGEDQERPHILELTT
jgi:hypothetical protein